MKTERGITRSRPNVSVSRYLSAATDQGALRHSTYAIPNDLLKPARGHLTGGKRNIPASVKVMLDKKV